MAYRFIAFDVDGTLLDTEKSELTNLGELVYEETGRRCSWEELLPTFGMTGPDALRYLGCTPEQAAVLRPRWHERSMAGVTTVPLFDGLAETLEALHAAGIGMGIVTSRGKPTVERCVAARGWERYFPVRITQQDTDAHKPDPAPLLLCLERAGVSPAEALYVGDSPFDMECAANAGVDSALALWGTRQPGLACTHRLAQPADLLKLI